MTATPWASLGGIRVVSGSVSIPLYGPWAADLTLATDGAIPASPTLVLGNLSLQGTVVRQDAFAGARQVRLVGGFGGWMKQVPAQAYGMPVGTSLPISLVLNDLASLVGEKIAPGAAGTIGGQYTREAASAQRSLECISGGQWWIDGQGLTHVGLRAGAPIQSAFQIIHYDGGRGLVQVSTESPADWLPGNTFSAPTLPTAQAISQVTHTISDAGVARIDVLTMPTTGAPTDRLIAAFRALVKTELPTQTFLGTYEYAVQSTDGTTVDAKPTASNTGLPELTKIVLRAGLAGCSSTPGQGSLLAVAFLNGDPTRPYVVGGFDSTPATSVKLGGPAAAPIVPSTWATALKLALSAFTTTPILTPTTVAANGAALAIALNALPSDATTIVEAE